MTQQAALTPPTCRPTHLHACLPAAFAYLPFLPISASPNPPFHVLPSLKPSRAGLVLLRLALPTTYGRRCRTYGCPASRARLLLPPATATCDRQRQHFLTCSLGHPTGLPRCFSFLCAFFEPRLSHDAFWCAEEPAMGRLQHSMYHRGLRAFGTHKPPVMRMPGVTSLIIATT